MTICGVLTFIFLSITFSMCAMCIITFEIQPQPNIYALVGFASVMLAYPTGLIWGTNKIKGGR